MTWRSLKCCILTLLLIFTIQIQTSYAGICRDVVRTVGLVLGFRQYTLELEVVSRQTNKTVSRYVMSAMSKTVFINDSWLKTEKTAHARSLNRKGIFWRKSSSSERDVTDQSSQPIYSNQGKPVRFRAKIEPGSFWSNTGRADVEFFGGQSKTTQDSPDPHFLGGVHEFTKREFHTDSIPDYKFKLTTHWEALP
jgi:hypothetical protein